MILTKKGPKIPSQGTSGDTGQPERLHSGAVLTRIPNPLRRARRGKSPGELSVAPHDLCTPIRFLGLLFILADVGARWLR